MYKIIIIILIFSIFYILIKKESFSKYTSHCNNRDKSICCNMTNCKYNETYGCLNCSDPVHGNSCSNTSNSICN